MSYFNLIESEVSPNVGRLFQNLLSLQGFKIQRSSGLLNIAGVFYASVPMLCLWFSPLIVLGMQILDELVHNLLPNSCHAMIRLKQ